MTNLIPIPANTQPAQCKSCRQTIYWAPHPSSGKMHPVSVKQADAIAPSPFAEGKGISHFADCPNAAQHRRTN